VTRPPAGTTGRAAWLVEGDDPTLIADGVRSLVDDLLGDTDRALALEDFGGEDLDLGSVAEACQTPPFLADRRVVIVRDIGRFSPDEVGPLVEYLQDPLPTTALILAAGGGRVAPKLVAGVKKVGHVTATKVESRDSKAWVRRRLHEGPVELDAGAEALLGAHLGDDVGRLTALMDVLAAAYGEGATIDAGALEPYLGEAGGVAPWDLTDAIDSGHTEVALGRLHRLLGAGDRHPLVVLAIIERHLTSILRVDGPSITTEKQAAAALGIAAGRSTYPAKKALAGARRLGSERIAELVGLVAEAEVALKGGSTWPSELVLEVLVARLCRIMRSRASSSRTSARR
jgi:DNA polymerase III subunit delta